MNGKSETTTADAVDIHDGGVLASLAARLIPPLEAGRLTVHLPSGGRIERTGSASGPDVSIAIHRWRALARLALGGDAGFSSSYVDGDWSTPDLLRLFQFAMLNERNTRESRVMGAPSRLLARLRHGWRRNTKRGSRRNIAEHYDLGNDFYRHWLDAGMTYSAAPFEPGDTLETAQQGKIDRIAGMLDVGAGKDVLEIGCGWGSVAESLVREHGCRITGVTLSQEQHDYARQRLQPEIDAGRAAIELRDYRDVSGKFDRIVSIEMFEAVGEAYWTTYFQALRDRLRSGGTVVLQVITIAEERFDRYRRSPDFIQQYIFPGGMLPTKSQIHDLAAGAGFRVTDAFSFGEGYAATLAEWRRRFLRAWPRLEPLGFDDRFRRMWDYYLAYCEVGFEFKATDVTLFQLKPAG